MSAEMGRGEVGGGGSLVVPRSAGQRARALLAAVPLMAVSAGLLLAAFGLAWGPLRGAGERWALGALVLMLTLAAFPAWAGLACLAAALGPVLARDSFDAAGLTRRLPWSRRQVPWEDVYLLERTAGWALQAGRDRLEVPSAPGFAARHDGIVRRQWRRRVSGSGRRLMPLVLQSVLSGRAWTAAGAAAGLVGVVLLGASVRPGGPAACRWVGLAFLAAGALMLLRARRITAERVELTLEGIARTTFLASRSISWGRVEYLQRRMLQAEGRPWHGKVTVGSFAGRVRFRLRPEAYRQVARLLARRSPGAFHVDDETGAVTAPNLGDRTLLRDRMQTLVARLRRRYITLAVLQLVFFPVMALATAFAAFVAVTSHIAAVGSAAPILYLDAPFTWGDTIRNFRRARRARESLQAFEGAAA